MKREMRSFYHRCVEIDLEAVDGLTEAGPPAEAVVKKKCQGQRIEVELCKEMFLTKTHSCIIGLRRGSSVVKMLELSV